MILVAVNHPVEGQPGLPYVSYELDGVETIGVSPDGERYHLVIRNTRDESVDAAISIDGIDLGTGQPATRHPHNECLVLRPRESLIVDPYADGGNELVFSCFGGGEPIPSVPDQLGGPGMIAVAFFSVETDETIETGQLRYLDLNDLQRELRAKGVEVAQYGSGAA